MISSLFLAAALQAFSIQDSASHDSNRYTQGLFFHGKELVETTGIYGKSSLFRMQKPGGPATDSTHLRDAYFGEGSIQIDNEIIWLTWREHKAFVYDAKTLALKGEFQIPTEGWGLDLWNGMLLMSNGSAELLCLSLGDHQVLKTITITENDNPVSNLNELEVVGNTLYANLWGSDSIAVIDLKKGKVTSWIDFSIQAKKVRAKNSKAEVLNGIAYDGKDFWITGKYWPVMYKIRLKK
jgi:glutaminyl-peptide cyclotransferase